MLADRYSPDELAKCFSAAEWRPVPPAVDRQAWIDRERHPLRFRQVSWLVGRAEGRMGIPWSPLTATMAMRFSRDGNRSEFRENFFRRRNRLGHAVLAECFEYHGRFLDEIIDGLCLISEETSWCKPAHYGYMAPGDNTPLPLPPADTHLVDLFAAETAMVLSEACWLLGDAIDGVSPVVRQRVRNEVQRRVLDPFLEREDWPWADGHNNWAPWICSNVLGAACHCELPVRDLAAIAHKALLITDRFVAYYGDDGGCDEGPGYWGYSAGALCYFYEHLLARSGGTVDGYRQPKIRAMARYPLVTHLGWQWFANFSDASPLLRPPRAKTWRLGERCDLPELRNLAQLSMRGFDPLAPVDPPLWHGTHGGDLMHMLRELWWIDPEAEATPTRRHDKDRWLPDVQHLVAHEEEEDAIGLVLAAKAGHNGENHNHLDVGHFILMLDGVPALIDVGPGDYSRDTFSPARYEQWYYGSEGHAVPCVNGHSQQVGRRFAAAAVSHGAAQDRSWLTAELAGCYAPESDIRGLHRRLELFRGDDPRVELEDRITLAAGPVAVRVPLHSPRSIVDSEPGRLVLDCGVRHLAIEYDPAVVSIAPEAVTIDDGKQRSWWGPSLNRLVVAAAGPTAELTYRLVFRPGD